MNAKGTLRIAPMHNAPNLPAADALLTAREFADGLRISLSTFRRAAKVGGIPEPVNVSPRCQRWPASDLRSMLEAQRKGK
jgi:predicted DNA-binding transcriptional regulator AlpA